MKKQRPLGLTLVEMLIVMVLIVTISGAVLTLLVRGRVIWATRVAPARTVEQAGVLLERFVSELEDSHAASVALLDLPKAGKGVVFASAWNDNQFVVDPDTGKPLWQNYVVFGTNPDQVATFRWETSHAAADRLSAGLKPDPGDKTFLQGLEKSQPTRLSDVRLTPLELNVASDEGHVIKLKFSIEDQERQWELARWVYLQD